MGFSLRVFQYRYSKSLSLENALIKFLCCHHGKFPAARVRYAKGRSGDLSGTQVARRIRWSGPRHRHIAGGSPWNWYNT